MATFATDVANRPARKHWTADLARTAAVLAAGVLLRTLFLGKSLWLDEGIAVGNAWAGGLPLSEWSDWFARLWSHSEFNMVLYFAALRLWLHIGSGEAFIRMLSVIFAVATLPVVYAIGRRLFDRPIAIVATLLLAIHGAHIAYSQEARGYTMAVFFCAVATYFFLQGVERGRWWTWLLYTLSAVLGTYCHLFALLVVGSHTISLVITRRRTTQWLRLLGSLILLFVLVSPALFFAATNEGHQVEWIAKLGPSQVLNTLSELAGSPVALAPYLVLWTFGVLYCRRCWSSGDEVRRWQAALVLSWAFAPMLMAIMISIRKPMLVPRYLLISTPGAVLLAAKGAYEMRPRWRQITVWSAVALSVGFVAFRYTRPKENWRDATQYVLSHAQKGDAVVVVPGWSEPVFDYYRRRNSNAKVVELSPAAVTGESVARGSGHERLWVVAYARDYALKERDTRAVLERVDRECQLTDAAEFRMLHVRLYGPVCSR